MGGGEVLAVVGNPKVRSRTSGAAEAVATAISDHLAVHGAAPPVETIEVAELGADLLAWGAPSVTSTVERMAAASALVVASPVYKATYTGLLKLLLDNVAAGQLASTVAVPMMVGAAPQHAMAVEAHLRPLLIELGAQCPTAGIYLCEKDLPGIDAVVDAWGAIAGSRLAAAAAAAAVGRVPARSTSVSSA